MTIIHEVITNPYKDIMQRTEKDYPTAFRTIDEVLNEIRAHIRGIDQRVFCQRNELLTAIRLVEAFRIFNWIKVCLSCGAYQSIFRELRFMIDGVAQACYIDLNHHGASLVSKLEVYKALGKMGGFIGSNLFNRITEYQQKQELKDLYNALSLFVHPSIEESRKWIDSPPPEGVVDSLKFNRYDRELLGQALDQCKKVGSLLISISRHFVEQCIKRLDQNV